MLCYRLAGNGTPLLLIHGWGVTYAIWQNLVPLLTPHFQVIMIELPGVGSSPEVDPSKPYYQACAEAIEEVRQELGIKQWSLLAYSSGTRAAEAYLQCYPQSILQAAFLCPIYLQEIWAFFLRLLDTPYPQILTQWIFSDWRLYSLIRVLGFNWKSHTYTHIWKNEIELQPLNTLIRSLREMPGNGRAPFELPAVPTLFIWGKYDALVRRPRHPRTNDVTIAADHSAPMLAAASVAEVVIPFLTEGRLVPSTTPQKRPKRSLRLREKSKAISKAREHARLLNILLRFERRRFLRKIRKKLLKRRK
jgi:pimeloyl-ACP methyl ester carboxylesterase